MRNCQQNPLPLSTNSLSSILHYACHIPCRELFVPSRCESPKKVCTLRKGKKIKHKGSELLCVSRSSFHSKTQLPLRVILAQQFCAGMVETSAHIQALVNCRGSKVSPLGDQRQCAFCKVDDSRSSFGNSILSLAQSVGVSRHRLLITVVDDGT